MLQAAATPSAAAGWLTLPTTCTICRRWSDAALCPACRSRHAAPRLRCRSCGLPTGVQVTRCGECLADPPPFEHTAVAVDYTHPWDRLISGFKFHGRIERAALFGALMADAFAASALPMPEVLVPVPLSSSGLRERGFNQAWELARVVARRLRVDARAEALERVTAVAHQTELGRAQRRANLRAAFVVLPRQAAGLRGRRVLLVDDVMTTGATLDELARCLKGRGASWVGNLVVARTPSPS